MTRSPLHRVLEIPWVYTFTQTLWYRRGRQKEYVTSWIRPRPGDRILDIGCGPGRLLEWMPDVRYVGFDPNPRYIAQAKARLGHRGRFECGYLTNLLPEDRGQFDIVLANGVLHHLSDSQVQDILTLARQALKREGRMVTRDGCYEEKQNRLTRLLLRSDRGAFVRTQAAYEALFRPFFAVTKVKIVRDVLRLPYSLIHFEAVNNQCLS